MQTPQLISLLKPSFERSADSIVTSRENALFKTLTLKEAERNELLSMRCSELEERLGLKQREVDNYKIDLENLKEEVKDLYIELMAEKMNCEELRARVSQLEKERGVIEISDSEDDNVKSTVDLKTQEILEKDEDFLLTPTPRRKRASRMVTSDSEDDEDNVPITKVKKGRLEEEEKEEKQESHRSPVNCFSQCNDQKNENVVVVEDDYDDDDDDVPIGKLKERRLRANSGNRDNVTPSRRRLAKLGECSTMKDGERGTCPRDSVSQNPLNSKTNSMNRSKRSTARQQLVFSDAKEKEMDDVDSGSEGDSLDGFIVDESESDSLGSKSSSNGSSEKENEEGGSSDTSAEDSASDVDLDYVLRTFRRKKDSKTWQYEADMLASFAEDPELCMKAVCALYRQQTFEEQSIKGTIAVNGRGFNQADAFKASMIAEFLLDGDSYGPLKKSVKEFEERYPNGLEYCRKIADRYSKQLFTICQQGEDPFFLPP